MNNLIIRMCVLVTTFNIIHINAQCALQPDVNVGDLNVGVKTSGSSSGDNSCLFNGDLATSKGKLVLGGGEGLGSVRTSGNNQNGIDIYTNFRKRIMVSGQKTAIGLLYTSGSESTPDTYAFTPTSNLHVRGNSSDILTLQNITGAQAVHLNMNTTNNNTYVSARFSAIDNKNWGSHLALSTSPGGSGTSSPLIERMRIADNGHIGIGGNVGIGYGYPANAAATPSLLTLNTNGTAISGLLITEGQTNTEVASAGANINLQTFGGGYHAINFNGFHNGVDPRYNNTKNRWRIVVDQRTAADGFSIDNSGGLVLGANANGDVSIGRETVNGGYPKFATGYKLSVSGKIMCEELKVLLRASWPDYVFAKDYKLMPLEDVATYVAVNHHLPEVPSEKEVTENGISTGEMHGVLLKKIEELTLYLIEQKKDIDALKKENADLKAAIQK